MTIAYLIWCEARRNEWNLTLKELSDTIADYMQDLTVTIPAVQRICASRSEDGKTWLNMLRTTTASNMMFSSAPVA